MVLLYYFSLGLAYAGTNRSDVIELISNALREGNPTIEVERLFLIFLLIYFRLYFRLFLSHVFQLV